MKKRLNCMLMALVMVLSIMPTPALASYYYSVLKDDPTKYCKGGVFYIRFKEYAGWEDLETDEFKYDSKTKTLELKAGTFRVEKNNEYPAGTYFYLCNDSVEGMTVTLAGPATILLQYSGFQRGIYINAKTITRGGTVRRGPLRLASYQAPRRKKRRDGAASRLCRPSGKSWILLARAALRQLSCEMFLKGALLPLYCFSA